MKKTGLLLIVMLVILIGYATGLSSDLRESYESQETVVVKFSGNLLEPIQKDNIKIKEVNVEIPVEYDLKKIDNSYYLWFITPEQEGEYSLNVYGVLAIIEGKTKRFDFVQNFSVSKEKSEYYINPGFIVSSKDFKVDVFLQSDLQKEIEINFINDWKYNLNSGYNELKIDVGYIEETGLYSLKIGKYLIPTYIFVNKKPPVIETSYSVVFGPDKINGVVGKDSLRERFKFWIINQGSTYVSDVYLDYDRRLFEVTPDEKSNLELNETKFYDINLREGIKSGKGIIYLRQDSNSDMMEVEIKFDNETEGYSVSYGSEKSSEDSEDFCSSLGGDACTVDESCSGQIITNKNQLCCIGTCIKKESEKKSNISWLGYTIVILIILLLIFIGYKYYKVKPEIKKV